MQRDPEAFLHDILDACRFLAGFTKAKTLEDFKSDRGFRSAVERELLTIGEAMMQLDRTAPLVAERISEYRNIIGFRHVLVHGYAGLKPETVWGVVETKLEPLEREIRDLLQERGYAT